MFESTTHRYAENKRRNTKLTHEMVIQATSVLSDASSHVDFLPSLPGSNKCSSFNVDSEIDLTDTLPSQRARIRQVLKEQNKLIWMLTRSHPQKPSLAHLTNSPPSSFIILVVVVVASALVTKVTVLLSPHRRGEAPFVLDYLEVTARFPNEFRSHFYQDWGRSY